MKSSLLSLIAVFGVSVTPVYGQAAGTESASQSAVHEEARSQESGQLGERLADRGPMRDGGGLQEVIVTAQKYRQRALEVPISLTVINGSDLRRLGMTNLEDLQLLVPGMFVANEGIELNITIRGISNLFGQKALVGTYLDDADVSSEGNFGVDLETYDLARVEVLKGPQGTLYGGGSVGGTIRYITNKPVLDELYMSVRGTALFDQYGAPESQLQATANAPLVAGVLGLRVAAEVDNGGGWMDQPAAEQKNINGKSLADVRIQGRWQPTENFTVDAMEVIHRNTSGTSTGENPPGIFVQEFNLTTTPRIEDNYDISNITINWDLGPATVVNSATYFNHQNVELNYGFALPLTPPPSPLTHEFFPYAPIVDSGKSDELRISGNGASRLKWTAGAFYRRLDDNTPPYLYYFAVPGPPGSPLPAPYPYFSDVLSKSRSVFLDANYRLFGGLTFGAGVRYFRDNESSLIEGDVQGEEATFTSTDPRFYVRYGVTKDVSIYASAAKGFRSGGFNGFGLPQYQPEQVWTYELGSKLSLLGGNLMLDSDAFLSSYGGYQIVGVAPNNPADFTHNAGYARIKGIEADLAWRPTDRWEIGVNGDYINARFVEVNVMFASYQVGDPLDYVPRYQATAWTIRRFSWHGKPGFARFDYTQRARATFRNRSIGDWYYSRSNYMYLLGFNAAINVTKDAEVGFLAQNLLNNRGYVSPDSIENFAAREQPRTFGVYFDVKIK